MTSTTAAAAETVTRLQQREISAVLRAARRARAAYRGPVGEFLSRELFGYIQTGRRASPTALVSRLLEDLEGLPDAGGEVWPIPAVLAARPAAGLPGSAGDRRQPGNSVAASPARSVAP